MSDEYNYNPVDGYVNADMLHAGKAKYNPEILSIYESISKLAPTDVSAAINLVAEVKKREQTQAIYYTDKEGNLIRDDGIVDLANEKSKDDNLELNSSAEELAEGAREYTNSKENGESETSYEVEENKINNEVEENVR